MRASYPTRAVAVLTGPMSIALDRLGDPDDPGELRRRRRPVADCRPDRRAVGNLFGTTEVGGRPIRHGVRTGGQRLRPPAVFVGKL